MREVVKPGVAVFVTFLALAVLSSGCGSQGQQFARSDSDLPPLPIVLEGYADLVDVRAATPAVAVRQAHDGGVLSVPKGAVAIGGLLTGYQHHYRRGPPGPYRVYGLLTTAQLTVETGATLARTTVKLGRGKGWSMTFADNFLGGEGWIGSATYDIEGVSSKANLSFIRGGFRMAYLDARPLYGFVSAGVSVDWLSSSEFDTLATVNIGDQSVWNPVGFYFRFGGGLTLANVVVFGELLMTGAWMSDANFITQGLLTTWGASVGVGVVF